MINSFNNFVGGSIEPTNNKTHGYIYVLEYILGKNNYVDELKDYIINYIDEESDYEDDSTRDSFMKKLKVLANEDNFDEIEEMILSYDEYLNKDYDDDDEDFEEKMYNSNFKYSEPYNNIEDTNYQEIYEKIDNSSLSEQLESFLKIDIEFEDLGKEENEEFEFLGKDVCEQIDEEITKDEKQVELLPLSIQVASKMIDGDIVGGIGRNLDSISNKKIDELIENSNRQDKEYEKIKEKKSNKD